MCHILAFRIVPDGSHVHVVSVLEEILGLQGEQVTTKAHYSDKAKADKNLSEIFTNHYSKHAGGPVTTIILNDIWHAQNRVVKHLLKTHPDYWSAVNGMKSIFAPLVKLDCPYKSSNDLRKAFLDWEKKYSSVQNAYSGMEAIKEAVNVLSGSSTASTTSKSIGMFVTTSYTLMTIV